VRLSQSFLFTAKEAPADAAGASHILLTRGAYIRRVGSGMYTFLPLGLRVLRKIETIVRDEINQTGAQELLLPTLLPAEYFRETGRWDGFGDTLFRLRDRKGGEYHLGPTHEEIITDLLRREVKSYRDLPHVLYQIQTKYRDEPRPRAGLLRGREFVMKDAYSFDATEQGAQQSYERMRGAYLRIFNRVGVTFRMVQADSGAMGGNQSAEFQVLVQSGEDAIAASDASEYAANLEVATCLAPTESPFPDEALADVERVSTVGQRTLADVATFLNIDSQRCLKSLLFIGTNADGTTTSPVLVVLRGDHQVNETKLARALQVSTVRLASETEVYQTVGAPVGSIGPVNFAGKILVDCDARFVTNAVVGANEKNVHLLHVNFGRDYEGDVSDVRNVVDGDRSPDGNGHLRVYRGIEGGHIFLLGTRYSKTMGATFLAEDGSSRPMIMGCYGIGISRLVATIVEQHHDEHGIRWPLAVAPYHVHLITLGKNDELCTKAEALVHSLERQGIEVLWDDRDERPGVKFKDADLIGIPFRVTLGEKGLKTNTLEWKQRDNSDAKAFESLDLTTGAETIAQRIHQALARETT